MLLHLGRRLDPGDALLDQAGAPISQQQPAPLSTSPWRVVPEILRTAVACLALFFGFAGLARGKDAELPWLMELQRQWETLQDRVLTMRAPRGPRRDESLRDLVDQLAKPDEPNR